MSFLISPVERMVLESIGKKPKSLFELIDDTKIEKRILQNILNSLTAKNIIVFNNEYSISNHLNSEIIALLKEKNSVATEVSQIIKSIVKCHMQQQGCHFKLQKVYMNEKEEQVFKSLLIQLQDFIEGLDKNRGKTFEQKVIFWGVNNYENITNNMLYHS